MEKYVCLVELAPEPLSIIPTKSGKSGIENENRDGIVDEKTIFWSVRFQLLNFNLLEIVF